MGVILSSCLSISPCSKNSELTRSATRFSISQGFVIADKSHTVILIARRSERLSSFDHTSGGVAEVLIKFKNDPRFLYYSKELINLQLSSKVNI